MAAEEEGMSYTTEEREERWWLILRYVPAEPPCWKGEVSVVLGWGRKEAGDGTSTGGPGG